MNSNQLKVLFTHDDLDGVGCGILHKAAFKTNADVKYCGYGNIDDRIQDFLQHVKQTQPDNPPTIVVTDIGINEDTAKQLDNYAGQVKLYDHHKSNYWLSYRYGWAYIDETRSGTKIYFDILMDSDVDDKFTVNEFKRFVDYVDDYDRWVHDIPMSKETNRLRYIYGIDRFVERTLSKVKPHVVDHIDMTVLSLEQERINAYIDKLTQSARVFEGDDDKRFGVVFCDTYQSEAGHELMDRLDLNMIALINANNKVISFRSRGEFDVGAIAEAFGGGGHKNAAGVQFDFDDKLIKSNYVGSYPLLGTRIGIEEAVQHLFADVRSEHYSQETDEIEGLFRQVIGHELDS